MSLSRLEISRLITAIENRDPKVFTQLERCFHSQSLRRTICFTGPGGVGKSSLLAQLTQQHIQQSRHSLAWLACDPSSPKTGGSLLGDRIRLSGMEVDEKIFVRSLSTRSSQAYSKAIRDIAIFLESLFDHVWIETAGSGQTQSEVSSLASLTVLVLQPETGDEVQWMKSGLRECVDLFVVNKSDLGGAESMRQSLIDLGAAPERVCLASTRKREGLKDVLTTLADLQSQLDWKRRAADLHLKHAEALFFESEQRRLQKKFAAQKSLWRKNPYKQALKILN